MTRTEYHRLDAPQFGGSGEIVVHGHWGRPVLWFPDQDGSVHGFADHGILDAVRPAIDAGRIKVYCVPGCDADAWSATWKPLDHRARAFRAWEDWVLQSVVPWIRETSGGRGDLAVTGPSLGAFTAVLLALRHADVFPRAVALSGSYDPWRWHAWGEATELTYLTDPEQFVPGLHGEHLAWLQRTVALTLVVGSGRWEDSTGARDSTIWLAGMLADKGISHELHVWGEEWPHDWLSWRAQAAVYLSQLG